MPNYSYPLLSFKDTDNINLEDLLSGFDIRVLLYESVKFILDSISDRTLLIKSLNNISKFIIQRNSEQKKDLHLMSTLKEINAFIKVLKDMQNIEEKKDDSIVFTTFSDDPNLLLRTGDLTNSSSCQNYRTGGMINTLPGYVVDANVKLLLAYKITPSLFKDHSDYTLLKDKLKKTGVDSLREDIKFDHSKEVMEIKIDGNRTITIKFPEAQQRHVVKVGYTKENKAALFLERAYHSNNPQVVVNSAVQIFFDSFATEGNFTVNERMTVVASRNFPHGHYSDFLYGPTGVTNYEVGKKNISTY